MIYRKHWLRLLTGGLLGILFLWASSRDVSWSKFLFSVKSTDYGLVLVAAAFVLVGTLIRTWSWGYLYRPTPVQVSFFRAWRIVIIGQFINIVVPARAGDVARIFLIGEASQVPKLTALTSLVLEKLFDMSTLVLVLFVISIQTELPDILQEMAIFIACLTILLASLVFAVLYKLDWLEQYLSVREAVTKGWKHNVCSRCLSVLEGVRVLGRWPTTLLIQSGYLVTWCTLGLASYITMLALGIDLPPVAALVVVAVVQLGTAIPSTPGKVGVFQYLSVLALGLFGVNGDVALSYGIVLHFVSYVPIMFLGVLGVWSEFPYLKQVRVDE